MRMASLRTTDDVIDLLGGNGPTGEIVDASPKAVSNWRAAQRGKFPPETYVALTEALARLGKKADPRLWSMIQGGAKARRARARKPAPAEGATV